MSLCGFAKLILPNTIKRAFQFGVAAVYQIHIILPCYTTFLRWTLKLFRELQERGCFWMSIKRKSIITL